MKSLIFWTVFAVSSFEYGCIAYDKMQANITAEITRLYEQAEQRAAQ